LTAKSGALLADGTIARGSVVTCFWCLITPPLSTLFTIDIFCLKSYPALTLLTAIETNDNSFIRTAVTPVPL
jgi:hypothetical protein